MGDGAHADVVAPSLAALKQAVGTAFTVGEASLDGVVLTLVDVTTFAPLAGWESFSVLFAGARPAIPQATYAVDHDSLGAFPLFLVPIQTEGDEQRYETVFNRPTP